MNFHLNCGYNLNTYKIIPQDMEKSLSDLVDLCIERINLYKLLEKSKQLEPGTKDWGVFMKNEVKTHELKTYNILLQHEENVGVTNARKNDHLAHWLLSLCYCRTDELKYNFIRWELQWFILLYKQMTKIEVQKFLCDHNFVFESVPSHEKDLLKDKLEHCPGYKKTWLWCKAPFHTISTHLISCRKIFLHRGIAYFPENYIIYCVIYTLIKQFTEQLTWNNRMMLTKSIDDDHIKSLLEITPIFSVSKYKLGSLEVNLDNIEEIAQHNYPLCMHNLHTVLKEKHHLKYDSKMQYGIFLKWLGLSYEDAMVFWEEEFTKTFTKDWFARKYSYLFKHQYGRVGGKIDYPPHSCEQIQARTPLVNQCHGCPFKHWDEGILLKKLQVDSLNLGDIKHIIDLVSQNRYTEACTAYFSAKHNIIREDKIQSPNQYASESYKIETSLNNLMESICNILD